MRCRRSGRGSDMSPGPRARRAPTSANFAAERSPMRAAAARQAGGADNDDALILPHIRARPVSLTRAEENVARSRASKVSARSA